MRKPALIALAAFVAIMAIAVTILRRARGASHERVVSERPLDAMTRDELYELAKEHDIPGRSKMKKDELRAALQNGR